MPARGLREPELGGVWWTKAGAQLLISKGPCSRAILWDLFCLFAIYTGFFFVRCMKKYSPPKLTTKATAGTSTATVLA